MKVLLASVAIIASSVDTDAACPYQSTWMKYGSKRAAEIIQEKHGRSDIASIASNPRHGKLFKTLSVDSPPIGYGTCEYENPFSGTSDCVQLTGSGWNEESAGAMCANAMMGMAAGTLKKDAECAAKTNPLLAGYCYTKEGTPQAEAMPMTMNPSMAMMADCKSVANGCTMWSQGRFVYTGACNPDGTQKSPEELAKMAQDAPAAPAAAAKTKPECSLAPGPMGAAHQHAWSPGYPKDCEDAPGKNSPYQWPTRYSAKFNATTMPVKSTGRKAYQSYGTVYYDFEKNYKRVDTVTQPGGSLPFVTADMVGSDNNTVLHRGSEMVFINYWPNGTKTCSKMDLGVIGNVRPDWFMDNRGAATSTQFLGNQHIFHRGEPTLVKQWRKKDFADMFFVMSMSAEPDADGYHWPLQRNDPGEGFGDDALHSFFDHRPLADTDEARRSVFMIDAELDCPSRAGSESDGPPPMDEEEPSNLNVDEAGWFEFEYTLSPGGPETAAEAQEEASQGSSGSMVVSGGDVTGKKAGKMGGEVYDLLGVGTLEVCMEGGDLKALASFPSSEQSWTAIGLRPADSPKFCAMTPATITLGEFEGGEGGSVKTGPLLATLHKFEASPSDLENQYSKMESANSESEITYEDSTISLSFTTPLDSDYKNGEHIPITWALGKTPTLQYHATRGCLDLKNVPACGSVVAMPAAGGVGLSDAVKADISKAAQCTTDMKDLSSKLDTIQATLEAMKPKPARCEALRNMKTCKRNPECTWSMATKCTNVKN